jgi:DNA polymerase/3'-5' exonuclease PolX
MSSATTRIPLDEARAIADQLVALIALSCERIVVAGSIRREAADCGDIDLVCEPKVEPLVDMFGEPTGESIDHLHDRLCDLERLGTIGKRRNALGQASWGRQLKRATYRDLSVDVQVVTDRDSWGFWLLIRTGPALFNKALVTPRWQGGLLPPGFEVKDGFKLYRGGGRIPTPREEDVFEAIGIPYLDPSARSTIGGAG